jgi:hypothetical protein
MGQQFASLDKMFIPYNNMANDKPELREYPIILDLYSKNRHFDGYWGMLSWRFAEKTKISGKQLYDSILNNPDYDVYHVNPFFDEVTKFSNPFTQGDCHHPGMIDFTNRLLNKMGYDIDINKEHFEKDNFIYCSYYIGNNKFWDQWIVFLETAITIANNDLELNAYLYDTGTNYRERITINFPFVIERLVNLFLFIYKSEYKIKRL